MVIYATEDATVSDVIAAEPYHTFVFKDAKTNVAEECKLWDIADKTKFFIIEGGDEGEEFKHHFKGKGKGNTDNVHLVFGKKRKHPGGCKV